MKDSHLHAKSLPPSAGVDWDEVKRRLALAQQATATTEQLSREESLARMNARAELLAKVPVQPPDMSELVELIVFRLGKDRVALETQFVHEVIRQVETTPLPGSPTFLVGLMNLRGEVLPVMDLRSFLGMDQDDPAADRQVLVLGKERVEFGVVADEVADVRVLRIDEIQDPPGSIGGGSQEFVRGVTADALLVLDGETVMNDQRLYIDE